MITHSHLNKFNSKIARFFLIYFFQNPNQYNFDLSPYSIGFNSPNQTNQNTYSTSHLLTKLQQSFGLYPKLKQRLHSLKFRNKWKYLHHYYYYCRRLLYLHSSIICKWILYTFFHITWKEFSIDLLILLLWVYFVVSLLVFC